jgi:hypothetical protein
MDHSEAQYQGATERYVLGDLSVSEVEEFERHFFDCPQCSEELRTLFALQENARAVFIEQDSSPSLSNLPATEEVKPKAAREGWWRFSFVAPALAMLAVAAFLGFQIGERQSGDPQSISAFPLYAASRGSETVVGPAAGAQFFTLYMDRTWDRDFAAYRAVIREDPRAGQDLVSISIPAPAQGTAIQVLFPTKSLTPGRYVLSILGKDDSGKEVAAAEYPFTLRFR